MEWGAPPVTTHFFTIQLYIKLNSAARYVLQLRGVHIVWAALPSRYLFVDVDPKSELHVEVVKSGEQLQEEADFIVLFHAVDDVLNFERGSQLYCIHNVLLF